VNLKPEDFICGSCSALKLGAGMADCPKHGKDFIEFKCRYCCTVALWFCFGTTHFCEPCH
jgi:E3 ubiquitin-protein ligase MYCBP2